jgi:hypothetical protein
MLGQCIWLDRGLLRGCSLLSVRRECFLEAVAGGGLIPKVEALAALSGIMVRVGRARLKG